MKQEITPKTYLRSSLFGLMVALLFAVSLAFSMPHAASAESNYSDALATEYAQRWEMQSQYAVPAVTGYSNALALDYAERWSARTQSTSGMTEYSNALPMLYAQPWLDQMTTVQNDATLR